MRKILTAISMVLFLAGTQAFAADAMMMKNDGGKMMDSSKNMKKMAKKKHGMHKKAMMKKEMMDKKGM